MKSSELIIPFILMLLIGCSSKKFVEQTTFLKLEKIILKEEGFAQFFYWEIDDVKQLWEPELGDVNYLFKYRDSLKQALGTYVLEQAIEKEETQSLEKEIIVVAADGDRKNALLVHSGTLGKIRKINFLEAQILNYQVSRFPLLSHPTEFHGFIANHKEEQKVRIYFCSSDRGWPPKPDILLDQLEKDMQNGWELTYHLHNHYCEREKNYIGILAPSLADAQYFKMLVERFNLRKALITNGFHTVELNQNEVYKFESH
ncbi:MAG: hypothetical protein WBM77_01295 [Maribacter sp.]